MGVLLLEIFDANDAASRKKLLDHLKKNLDKVPPDRREWAEALLAQYENRDAFTNKKDLQIQNPPVKEGRSPEKVVKTIKGKRKTDGVKEVYNTLNTPVQDKLQQYGAFKSQSAIEGQVTQAHHGVGQSKHGVYRGTQMLASDDPFGWLYDDLTAQTDAGLSGGNSKANAYNLAGPYHQGDKNKQGIHQALDPVEILPGKRLEAAQFEVDAAKAWTGDGDFARVTDRGMETGASRSGVLENMRRKGLVTPKNEKAIIKDLMETPDTEALTNKAKKLGIKTSSQPGPVYNGAQMYAGTPGALKDTGLGIGSALLADLNKTRDAVKGDTQAQQALATDAGTGALLEKGIREGLKRAPAPVQSAVGNALRIVGLPVAALQTGLSIADATFRNPEVQKKYKDAKPGWESLKAAFGF